MVKIQKYSIDKSQRHNRSTIIANIQTYQSSCDKNNYFIYLILYYFWFLTCRSFFNKFSPIDLNVMSIFSRIPK